MRLRSERILTPGGVVSGELVVQDTQIAAVSSPSDDADHELIELGDHWIVPGFIDLHVHGGGGAQFNTGDPEEVLAAARFHAAHGTTALLATTVSAPAEELREALRAVSAAVRASDPVAEMLLGVHLEGPFLSPAHPGAMDPETFLAPESELVRRLMGDTTAGLRLMTLAPELPGAIELIRHLAGVGVIPSLGHSGATYEQAASGVDAGARSATHTFNAMAPLHHRRPGLVGAVLDLPEVSCELICDQVHVAPPALRLVHRAKGTSGVRVVTDAISAAGMSDGEYRLGSTEVTVRAGRARTTHTDAIAGSTLTMDTAVATAVDVLGIDLGEAVQMASANPARLLGLSDRKGAIVPGMDADLTVLGDDLRAQGTLIAGRWARRPAS